MQELQSCLSLESVFSERSFYKCVCGNYLVEDPFFFTLQIKWRETALMTFERRLFLPNQLVFYNKTVSLRGKQSHFFDLINCVATIKFNRNKVGGKTASEDLKAIYKAFLRRIRGQCKKKCLKSYYKMGRLAYLCSQCKCYLKLRSQFEEIKSEWDLFSTIKLKKVKQNIIYIPNHNNGIKIGTTIENSKYNFIGYMLFYDLKISYYKLLNYVEQKFYDENHIVAFILTNINEDDMLLTVHY